MGRRNDVSERPISDLFESLSAPQAWKLGGAIFTILTATAYGGFWFSKHISGGKNCDFVQQQITSINGEIRDVKNPMYTEYSDSFEQRQQLKLSQLENQLTLYVNRLGDCN